MKAMELRDLPMEDLKHKHEELVTEYFGLRIKHTLGQLENPLVLRRVRRDIARARTLLRERGESATRLRRRRTGTWAAKASKSKDKKDRDSA